MAVTHLGPQSTAGRLGDVRAAVKIYLQAIWQRRWVATIVCWAVCCAGWAGVALIPNSYESTARLYVNADTLLQPLLQGIAVNTDPSRQVEYLQRTLLSRPNLEQLVHLAGLDGQATTPAAKEAQLRALAATIHLSEQTSSLFTISYENRSPIVAKNVVQGMVTIFSEAAAGTSRSEMDNAQQFLTDQISKYASELTAADKRRAAFREKYADVLPAVNGGGNQLEAASAAVHQAQFAVNDAVAKRNSLRQQLASVKPLITVSQASPIVITSGGPAPSTAAEQLRQEQRRLATLLLTDTNEHPDVIAARREIAILKHEVEVEKKAGTGSSAATAGTQQATVANPVYTQLKLDLADADSQLASLRERLKEAQAQEKRVQSLVHEAPGVELQAENLDRDYNILKKDYEELVSRKQSAEIAQAADTQADRIQFRVVDAPQIPLKPASPNRPLLFSGVLIGAIAVGGGVAFALAQFDRSFPSIASLGAFALPVLGSVSTVEVFETRRRRLVQIAIFGSSLFVLLIIYGALVAATLMQYPGVP